MLDPEIREKLDNIEVTRCNGHRMVRCFCGEKISTTIVPHLRGKHPEVWEKWGLAFVELRNEGLSYFNIISQFKTRNHFLFTSSVAQREIQSLVEKKTARLVIPQKEKIAQWHPEKITVGRGTIWAFKDRGNWAVHKGDYRGNWAPEIPRILIDRYSKKRDIVLDPFVGGGTTMIESWLAGRRGFGIDINPTAVLTSNARIQEMADHAMNDSRVHLDEELRPVIVEGDAKKLSEHMHALGIENGSVKLVCAHPPYLDSLKYTEYVEDDLSHITDYVEFCDEIERVARQIFELLAESGHCAILIGDIRKARQIIPLGFFVMERFLQECFKLDSIIIKAQNKDSSTRFWFSKKDKLDFLISHEYLLILSKQ
jgi:hypothetical protein